MTFRWNREDGQATEFEFGENGDEPSVRCVERRGSSACRYSVAERRAYLASQLVRLVPSGAAVQFATIFLPGRELTLRAALKVKPKTEVLRLKRMLAKAMRRLSARNRKAFRAIGAVEPAIIDVREDGIRVRRVVAVHAHLLVWGVSAKEVRDVLKKGVKESANVKRPRKMSQAYSPAGALAYALKHLNDHRVTVREGGKNRIKRPPMKREMRIFDRWCRNFPATDAEVLIGLRRTAAGLTDYSVSQS
jgi:hypothetical protein